MVSILGSVYIPSIPLLVGGGPTQGVGIMENQDWEAVENVMLSWGFRV